ncbi:MAG: hypothetical protein AB7H97_12305, partial [Pseudobdellovibrionaceae bacterium]
INKIGVHFRPQSENHFYGDWKTVGIVNREQGPFYLIESPTPTVDALPKFYISMTLEGVDPKIVRLNPEKKSIEVATPETVNSIYELDGPNAPVRFVSVDAKELTEKQFAQLLAQKKWPISVQSYFLHDIEAHVPAVIVYALTPGTHWLRFVKALESLLGDYSTNQGKISMLVQTIDRLTGSTSELAKKTPNNPEALALFKSRINKYLDQALTDVGF